jgi:uncharacterized membrane protein YtjA (UPF0391 family)
VTRAALGAIGRNLLCNRAFKGVGEKKGERAMFSWAIAFLVIALIAAALGFGGVAGTAIVAERLIFVVIATLLASAAPGPAGRPR